MITFSKYHGCGNNFVIIRGKRTAGEGSAGQLSGAGAEVCDVNTAGADGSDSVGDGAGAGNGVF